MTLKEYMEINFPESLQGDLLDFADTYDNIYRVLASIFTKWESLEDVSDPYTEMTEEEVFALISNINDYFRKVLQTPEGRNRFDIDYDLMKN